MSKPRVRAPEPVTAQPTTYTIFMPDWHDDIKIECRQWEPEHGTERKLAKWAVVWMGSVWTKKDRWEYEPLPSSRTAAFFRRTRYDTIEEALQAAAKAKANVLSNPRSISALRSRMELAR